MAFRIAIFTVLAAHGLAQSCSGDACDEQLDEMGLMQVKSHAGTESDSRFGPIPMPKPVPVPTPAPTPEPTVLHEKIVLGALKTVFHNVSGWVYALALEQYGMDYQMVDAYGHYQLYAMFTGSGKPPEGLEPSCEEEGCPNLCEEQGLGNKSPCIDFLLTSQVPGTHTGLVLPAIDKEPWTIHGTAFDYWQQTLYAPDYSGIATLSDAAESECVDKEILGFETAAAGQGCEAMYCPACPGSDGVDETAFPYIYGPPLNESGFKYKIYKCNEYKNIIAEKLEKKEDFLTYGWALTPFSAWFPQLREVDLQEYRNYSYYIPRNGALNVRTPGKALMRNAARHKFPPRVAATLSAIFIGNEGVKDMCGWALDGGLCDYQSWDTACAKEAAQKWIYQNNVTDGEGPAGVASQYGMWPSYFW